MAKPSSIVSTLHIIRDPKPIVFALDGTIIRYIPTFCHDRRKTDVDL